MESNVATKTGEKRKRGQGSSTSSHKNVKVQVVTGSDASHGPHAVLANFPSIEPTSKTPFSIYSKPASGTTAAIESGSFSGTTETVEFTSVNNDSEPDPGHSSRYFVGVYNKRTATLELVDVPMHVVPCDVTAHKLLVDSRSSFDAANWRASRKTLGTLFGNAKARKATKEQERRQIDVNAIQGVATHLQQSIIDATTTLPAHGAMAVGVDTIRALPPHNMAAITPRDAYPLHDIVSQAELDTLDLQDITAAAEDHKPRALPWKTSWARHILRSWSKQGTPPSHENYALLLYISFLFLFLAKARPGSGHLPKEDELHNIPPLVLDGFYSRFAEKQRGDSRLLVTPTTRLKLINYLLILCLRLEDWTMNTATLSEDLHMTPAEVWNHFRALGCKSSKAPDEVISKAGILIAGRKVTLPIPLKFPKPKLRARK
ncbi:DNA-directed RNA polymerase I subunit rpa49 [Tulasnella sp. JGI-2019a]|nr:DNA-directed RNA polymerase I subunit rpa49 [Tulasnella sp. JGI-2019a]